jgi:hypothetical protein
MDDGDLALAQGLVLIDLEDAHECEQDHASSLLPRAQSLPAELKPLPRCGTPLHEAPKNEVSSKQAWIIGRTLPAINAVVKEKQETDRSKTLQRSRRAMYSLPTLEPLEPAGYKEVACKAPSPSLFSVRLKPLERKDQAPTPSTIATSVSLLSMSSGL